MNMEITVGYFKELIKDWPDDLELDFGGLEFYRLKQRSEKRLQVEFNQSVYKDKETGNVMVDNHK
jgi:hypothetical protein